MISSKPDVKVASIKTCPECGHVFQGNGWDGIDAHWKSKHEKVMPYVEAWPLIQNGSYPSASQAGRHLEADDASLSQSDKFKKAARDLGAMDDEEAFKDVLRKLGSAQPIEAHKASKQRGQPKNED